MQVVRLAESGLKSGWGLLMSDVSQLCEEVSELMSALKEQVEAIRALAESNGRLAAVLAEFVADEVTEDGGLSHPSVYLDGKPV